MLICSAYEDHQVQIREKIKEINKLNKEFGPSIQLVLVNRNEVVGYEMSIDMK